MMWKNSLRELGIKIDDYQEQEQENQRRRELTSNYKTTDSGGKSLILETGNLFQSLLALSLANLDNDVRVLTSKANTIA